MPRSSKAVAAVAATSGVVAVKPDAIELLFRREVTAFLATPPTLSTDEPVEVLATIERLSLSGRQQSVQLCRAGDEKWVTRTEGDRTYFPMVSRVTNKRVRDADDADLPDVEEPQVAATPKASKKRKGKARAVRDETPTPATYIREKDTKAPGAPARRQRQTRAVSVESAESELTMRKRVEEALARGRRRHTRSGAHGDDDDDETAVKQEESIDDLASLCGRVSGLDVHSAVDAESEYSHPVAGSSKM